MKTIITTITFLLISIIGISQNSKFAKLDSLFTILEKHDRFFGSVAVSQAGKIIYNRAIGYADIETKASNTNKTKFRIGSITKTFTATLIMKAVEMGKINLDNTIDEYFPRVQNADKITIRYMLNHRSGINTFTDREYLSYYTKPIKRTDLLNKIISKGVDFEPNTEYAYSNSNYVLLTLILEKIFKKSYGQIIEQHIVAPLDLVNTSYGGKINPTQNEARSYRMNTKWDKATEGHMSIPLGAGGIISTPTDLCHFAEALFGGKLISMESLKQMKPVSEDSYGFALEYKTIVDKKGIGHGGDIDAFTSTLTYFEDDGICFALTCNGSNYGKHDIAIAVLSEIFGKPYELPSFKFIELTSKELDKYLGTYESDELPMDLTISKKGNTLQLEVPGQSPSIIKAEGDHKFSIMKHGVKITFSPKDKKMLFEQQGMKFNLTLKDLSETKEISKTNLGNKTEQELDQYLGTYVSDKLPMDLTISRKENTLIAQGTGQPSFPLTTEGGHVFSYKKIGLSITFIPNEKKMNFEQGGQKFEMILKK